jgi:mRNA interferase RelE/StbE
MKQWRINVSGRARGQLIAIKDSRISQSISRRIDKLETEPEKQGKPLNDELSGYRSVRAVGQRYRIIYKIQEEQVVVLVVLVGIRKEGDKQDAYAQAKRLADLGLLDDIE